jgi:fructokinase
VSPQKILVGGGVGLGVAGLLERAVAKVPAILNGYLPQLDAATLRAMIAPPQLGADAGPLGAITLAQGIAGDASRRG